MKEPTGTDWSVYAECPICLVDEGRPCRSIVPRRGEEGLGHQGQPVIAHAHNGRPKKEGTMTKQLITLNVVRKTGNSHGPVLTVLGASGEKVWLRTDDGNPFPVRMPLFESAYCAYPLPEVPPAAKVRKSAAKKAEPTTPAEPVKKSELSDAQRNALIGATQAIVDVEKVGCTETVRKALERKGYVQTDSRELTPAGRELAYELARAQEEPEGKEKEDGTVTFYTVTWKVPGGKKRTNPIALEQGYTTEKDIPKMLAIKHLGGSANRADEIEIVEVKERTE